MKNSCCVLEIRAMSDECFWHYLIQDMLINHLGMFIRQQRAPMASTPSKSKKMDYCKARYLSDFGLSLWDCTWFKGWGYHPTQMNFTERWVKVWTRATHSAGFSDDHALALDTILSFSTLKGCTMWDWKPAHNLPPDRQHTTKACFNVDPIVWFNVNT